MKTAVLIMGNPQFISNNPKAQAFYAEIRDFLEKHGYLVTMDPGEPYTVPPKADLWIGHSRGADRLRFAPEGVRVLALGSAAPGAISHPLDNTRQLSGPSDMIPNKYHYVFTDEMKWAIETIGGVY